MTRLYRSRTNRVLGGVFGGIGEMYHIDPTALRLLFAVLAIVTGIFPMVVLYLIAWAIVPEQGVVVEPPPRAQ